MELTFAALMARAGDEPDAMYGLAARAVRDLRDGLDLSLPAAAGSHFHDGSPLTAHDVAFSLNDAEGQGPSDHHAAAARHRRRGGRRRPHRGRALCAEARRDVPLFVAGAADLLARLLRRRSRSTNRRWISPLG